MKNAALLFIVILLQHISLAQRNSIIAELGGSGLNIGLHYERQVIKTLPISLHVGHGRYIFNGQNRATFPLGINYYQNILGKKLFAEIGYSATYSKADVTLYFAIKKSPNYIQTNFWNHVPNLSLKLITKKKYLMKAGLSPVINHWGGTPWVHISYGKMF